MKVSIPQNNGSNEFSGRLSELDWLRVILVFAVFLHHVGMPFNGDDWIIVNANSSKALDDFMVYFEQFRLPTLFVIAGVGANILLSKKRPFTFLIEKLKRLLIPLTVGILLINPPQNYFKNPAEFVSLIGSYPELVLRFESMHLWFIEYLFVFSLLAIPLFFLLKSKTGARITSALEIISRKWCGLLSLGLILAVLRTGLKMPFPSDSHGIENLSSSTFYFFFFVMGMMLSQKPVLWHMLAERWRLHTLALFILSCVFYFYYFVDFSSYASTETLWSIWWAVCSLLAWVASLCFLGLGQQFLKNTPLWLTKANTLIYPFYILHQTVIVVCAFYIVQWSTGISVKLLSLFVSSFTVTALICMLIIYPFNFMRVLFGLKPKELSP